MTQNNEPLRITEKEGDVLEIYLTQEKTPIAYKRKLYELVERSGLTQTEAEKHLIQVPLKLELFYDINRGAFLVESEAPESCEIFNPYTGRGIPNDNLPEVEENPIKFLDSSIGQLLNMSGDLRTEVYDKHDFSTEHMGYIEEAIESIDEAVDKLNYIDLTEEREKWEQNIN